MLEVFAEMFPNAPIYTLIHVPGSVGPILGSREIHQSFLGSMPNIENNYRKFLPLFPKAAESLALPSDVDLVISSHHCVIKGVSIPKGAKHLSYVHSPMRYLYDQYDSYFGPHAPFAHRIGMKFFKNYLMTWDKRSCKNVDKILANSSFVQDRIQRVWGQQSDVVHPFVDLKDFTKKNNSKEDYYLMVTAFAPNKRVDLAITAFNRMNKKLIIIGTGQEEKRLKEMAGPTIEFKGSLSRNEVVEYFEKAKALIFPGVEDFGITPLESLASETPVVAFKAGGVLETLNSDVAEFFSEASVESLMGGVVRFESKQFNSEKLRLRATDFSRENFIKKMQMKIDEVMK